MHEFSIVEGILKEANKQGKPREIAVSIGELAGITNEEFEDAFRHMSKIVLKLEGEEGKVRCLGCGFEGRPRIVARMHTHCLFECTKCGGKALKVLEGGEIRLKSVKCL